MQVTKIEYVISATNPSNFPAEGNPEVAFMGRSNVGKSSLINAIVGRKNIAYTSSKPGKTQTINFFNLNDQIGLVDFPGYGYASRQFSDRLSYGQMMETYLKTRKTLKWVYLLIDFRHEPTEDDVLMYEYLKHLNIVIRVVATKVDKVGNSQLIKQQKLIRTKLQMADSDSLIMTSAEKHTGLDLITAELIQLQA